MNDLQERKRALLAESEVYRQTLKLEIYNLRLYVKQSKIDVKSFTTPNPWLLLGALGPFIGHRPTFSKWRLAGALVAGWRMYNRFGPMISKVWSVFSRKRRNRRGAEAEMAEARF